MIALKVVHLNTYDGNGGAGRACLRLSDALNQAGIDSKVLVYYQFGNNPSIHNLSKSPFAKAKAGAVRTVVTDRPRTPR